MADFRKMFFVLAALVMIIGAAVPASAQVQCTAFVANQPTLRQEGITEPAGDIILSCSGTPVGAQTQTQTVSLYVSGTSITSRQLYTGTTVPTSIPTEAALLINDCTSISGTSPTYGTSCATAGPVQGFLQNGALSFSGFLLPTASPFQIRLTNVRVNANSVAAGTFINGTVLGTFPIQNQSNLVLGVAQSSLSVAVASTSNFAQCTSTTTSGSVVTTLTVKELVNTAFKSPNVVTGAVGGVNNNTPGQWYQSTLNTESQTVLSSVPSTWTNAVGSTPGQADSATRIRVNFSNIPAGVTLTLPVTICATATCGTGTLASSATATTSGDVGNFSPASSNITLTSSGSVTYQVTAQNGAAIDSFLVPITVTYTYTPPSTPAVGTILVSATYAPTSAEVTTLNPSFGIPRFADTSVLTPVITIAACQTDLMFTFLTNQAGFDTGFEIANTSTDPFGSAAQNGTCTLNWYGSGPAAGTATTTPSIASGSAYTNLVSSAAAGFQGYMIAVCNFQFGHGFAFISDGYGQPGRGLSQGYMANIIPTPGITSSAVCGTTGVRCAVDASAAGTAIGRNATGEALNQ